MKNNFTIGHHEAFRREMLAGLCDQKDLDEIDEAVADIPNPPAMRKESEVSRVLSLLDELNGKGGAR